MPAFDGAADIDDKVAAVGKEALAACKEFLAARKEARQEYAETV